MNKRVPGGGNGSGKVNVHAQDMGGRVRVYADPLPSVPDELAALLAHALTEWMRQRPQLHLRHVVPVVRDGNTVELLGLYALHVFPDLSGQQLHAPKPDAAKPAAGRRHALLV